MTREQSEIYNKYLERLRVRLIEKYNQFGLRASGEFEEALEPEVTKSSMTLWGAAHSYYMERGRAPGKFPPYNPETGTFDEISEWVDNKGILPAEFVDKKKQFVYLVARKIAVEGITVPNQYNPGELIDSVVNDFLANDIYEMLKELGDVFLSQIRADVIGIMRQSLQAA